MTLLLSVLRCPDSAVPEQRRVPGGDYTIGRGADCDWVLQDPGGVLSRRHCVLEFRSGGWQLRDLSTNGTFVNHAADPVGRDRVAPLSDGDRLRIGGYEIELHLDQRAMDAVPGWGGARPGADAAPAWGGSNAGNAAAPSWTAQDRAADAGWDPLAPPASRGGGGAAPMPEDFDPFADDPPMPDHRSSVDDAFVPPRVVPVASPAAAARLGQDWDLDLSPAARPSPAAPGIDDWDLSPPPGAVSGASAPAARPSAPAVVPRAAPLPVPAKGAPQPAAARASERMPGAAKPAASGGFAPPAAADLSDPFADEAPLAAPAAAPGASATAPAGAATPASPQAVRPVAPPAASPRVPPAPTPPPPAPHGTDAAAGLAAFLAGAGLPPGALPGVAEPEAALRGLGAAFRAIIGGLRALLIARADVKREFRIEQTMLRAAGNNPLKFAATDEAAVLALATQGTRGLGAVAETITDLTAHQVATLAATQAAARALLDRLAPAALEAEMKGGGGLFGASREKLLWDGYKSLHQRVVEQFEDDFDSAFGKAFARAYEQAVKRDHPRGGSG